MSIVDDASHNPMREEDAMSKNHLHHGYHIRNFNFLGNKHEGNVEVFEVERAPEKLRCAHCGSRNITAYRTGTRDLTTGKTPCKIVKVRVRLSRLSCGDCGSLLQEPLDDLITAPDRAWSNH